MKIKKFIGTVLPVGVVLMVPFSRVFAHVVVKPDTAKIAAWQTFVMQVPVERDQPTSSLRLVIPAGLKYVMPNVKPGWTIEVKKTGEGEGAVVTEIDWKGGTIPTGQRDEFAFSAQVPAAATELQWKAYQTYQDGTVVSWDRLPSEEKSDNENEDSGPYSVTKVVNDLAKSTDVKTTSVETESSQRSVPMMLSLVSVALSSMALYFSRKK